MRMNVRQRTLLSAVLCAAILVAPLEVAQACTRILWNDNKLAVVVGRTMDWPESTEPILTVFPRGVKHNGGPLGHDIVVKDNALAWTAKYGSLVTTIYGVGTADGLNELSRSTAMHRRHHGPALPGAFPSLYRTTDDPGALCRLLFHRCISRLLRLRIGNR